MDRFYNSKERDSLLFYFHTVVLLSIKKKFIIGRFLHNP